MAELDTTCCTPEAQASCCGARDQSRMLRVRARRRLRVLSRRLRSRSHDLKRHGGTRNRAREIRRRGQDPRGRHPRCLLQPSRRGGRVRLSAVCRDRGRSRSSGQCVARVRDTDRCRRSVHELQPDRVAQSLGHLGHPDRLVWLEIGMDDRLAAALASRAVSAWARARDRQPSIYIRWRQPAGAQLIGVAGGLGEQQTAQAENLVADLEMLPSRSGQVARPGPARTHALIALRSTCPVGGSCHGPVGSAQLLDAE